MKTLGSSEATVNDPKKPFGPDQGWEVPPLDPLDPLNLEERNSDARSWAQLWRKTQRRDGVKEQTIPIPGVTPTDTKKAKPKGSSNTFVNQPYWMSENEAGDAGADASTGDAWPGRDGEDFLFDDPLVNQPKGRSLTNELGTTGLNRMGNRGQVLDKSNDCHDEKGEFCSTGGVEGTPLLYHGTSVESAEKIISGGLQISQSRDKIIWASEDRFKALSWAIATGESGSTIAVISVNAAGFTGEGPAKQSTSDVAPDNIKRIDFYKYDDVRPLRGTRSFETVQPFKTVLVNKASDILFVPLVILVTSKIWVEKDGHTGVMVAYMLPKDVAEKLAVAGGEKPEDMHVTIAYFGKDLESWQVDKIRSACARLTRQIAPLPGELGGTGHFPASESSEGREVTVALVDVPRLEVLRQRLLDDLASDKIEPLRNHGYTPHITLKYHDPGEGPGTKFQPIPITVGALTVCRGGDQYWNYPLNGSEVVKFNPDQPREPDGRFSGGELEGRHAEEAPDKGGPKSFVDASGNRQLPALGPTDIELSPLKREPEPSIMTSRSKLLDSFAISKEPVKEVSVDQLHAWQPIVMGEKLAPFNAATAPPIEAVRWRGNLIVYNGNHRAASAWASSAETIKAHVLNLDDPKNGKYLLPKFRIAKGYADPSDPEGWYAFDLDGTLAHHEKTKGPFDETHIGPPVPEDSPVWVELLRLLKDGKDVRIFTARVADDPDGKIEAAIQDWLKKSPAKRRLPVTNEKDPHMVALYDDRANRVERNTGIIKAQEKLRGQGDMDLSDAGKDQADEMAQHIARLGGFDRIISSDLKRAVQTAKPIGEATHTLVTTRKALRTRRWAEMEGKPVDDNLLAQMSYYEQNPNKRPPGKGEDGQEAETGKEFAKRSIGELQDALDWCRANPGKRMLMVTHGRLKKAFKAWIKNGQPSDKSLDPDVMMKKGGGKSLMRITENSDGDLGWEKVKLAKVGHLKPGLHVGRHAHTPENGPVGKFNPNHDEKGQFSSGEGGGQPSEYTTTPKGSIDRGKLPKPLGYRFRWMVHPNKGLIFDSNEFRLHPDWFSSMGLPTSGPAYDRIERGTVYADTSSKTIHVTNPVNPGEVPDGLIHIYQQSNPHLSSYKEVAAKRRVWRVVWANGAAQNYFKDEATARAHAKDVDSNQIDEVDLPPDQRMTHETEPYDPKLKPGDMPVQIPHHILDLETAAKDFDPDAN